MNKSLSHAFPPKDRNPRILIQNFNLQRNEKQYLLYKTEIRVEK